jgi:hypothetical protein
MKTPAAAAAAAPAIRHSPFAIRPSADAASVPHEIKSGHSSVVQIALDSESKPIPVKRAKDLSAAKLIHLEAAILAALKRPLVLELRAQITGRTPSQAFSQRTISAVCAVRIGAQK